MHTVQAKGILSAHNGMNVYRGCLHGCIYCDARSECYSFSHPFEDIEIKINAPELLEAKLLSKRQKCMIGTGAMSDPYIPIERTYRITRRCLELIEKYGYGIAIQTKSANILDDIDLIDRINQKTKAVVQMTLTTYDEELCKIVEPNVSTTKERFEVLMECKRRGIPTVVWLTPILPFINDTEENIRGILDYCIQADVKGIILWNMGLTLRKGDREYFYAALDQHFPGLKEKYIQRYGDSYELISPNNIPLMNLFQTTCQQHHILYHFNDVFHYLGTFQERKKNEQIQLF